MITLESLYGVRRSVLQNNGSIALAIEATPIAARIIRTVDGYSVQCYRGTVGNDNLVVSCKRIGERHTIGYDERHTVCL